MENHGVMQLDKEDHVIFGGGEDILRGETNLSHGDYSHYVVWHKNFPSCPANRNVLNKRFWPWVRIGFLPCAGFMCDHEWCMHPPRALPAPLGVRRLGWQQVLCQLLSLEAPKLPRSMRDQKLLLSSHLISPRAINTSYWELRSSECWGFLRLLYFRGDKRDK